MRSGRSSAAPEGSVEQTAYVGSEAVRITPDGFMSVGDLGWFDPDGYLYLADRGQDVIISGGVNVYPAEVEEVLLEHPAVDDVVVVGREDDDWGRRVHAIVQMCPGRDVLTSELKDFCRRRLEAAKVPKSFEIWPTIPRDEAGKIRRSVL